MVHHGALGAFATLYLPADVPAQPVCEALGQLQGVDMALTRAQAAQALDLPADRIGDVVVLADRFTALGTTAAQHDLRALDVPLRSHGGRGEQTVPLIVNRLLRKPAAERRMRNFDAFDLALNFAQ